MFSVFFAHAGIWRQRCFLLSSFREPLALPDSVKSIGSLAFYRLGGKLQNPIPASLACIAPNGYTNSMLSGCIVLPETLCKVGMDAFSCNNHLDEIALPACPFQAEEDAFRGVHRLAVHPGSAGEAIVQAMNLQPSRVRRL